MWKVEERKEEVPAPITLPPLDEHLQAELHQRYGEAGDAETLTHYQMIVLAQSGQTAPHIARLVLRSEDTVERVLKRFLTGGLDAVPRRSAPGRKRTITSAWEAELVRVIELDPHEVGQETANWTTELLADYLGQQTGVTVSLETVRVPACAWVCLQATDLDVTTQS
jgi:transposase